MGTNNPKPPTLRFLDKKHAHPRDMHVRFEELNHVYYLNKTPEDDTKWTTKMIKSATGLIHDFFAEFDGPKIAQGIYARMSVSVNKGQPVEERYKKYEGMTAKDIEDSWEKNRVTASEEGTSMHASIEDFYHGELTPDQFPRIKEFAHFMYFHRQHVLTNGWVPFRSEMIVWELDTYRLCGSIDMLYVSKFDKETGRLTLVLVDWKRSKEIKKVAFGGKKGSGPCKSIPDCNYWHYAIQVNLYKKMLQTFYGKGFKYEGADVTSVFVEKMMIVVCHPNNDSYELHEMPEIQHVIDGILRTRKTFIEYEYKEDEQKNEQEEMKEGQIIPPSNSLYDKVIYFDEKIPDDFMMNSSNVVHIDIRERNNCFADRLDYDDFVDFVTENGRRPTLVIYQREKKSWASEYATADAGLIERVIVVVCKIS